MLATLLYTPVKPWDLTDLQPIRETVAANLLVIDSYLPSKII